MPKTAHRVLSPYDNDDIISLKQPWSAQRPPALELAWVHPDQHCAAGAAPSLAPPRLVCRWHIDAQTGRPVCLWTEAGAPHAV